MDIYYFLGLLRWIYFLITAVIVLIFVAIITLIKIRSYWKIRKYSKEIETIKNQDLKMIYSFHLKYNTKYEEIKKELISEISKTRNLRNLEVSNPIISEEDKETLEFITFTYKYRDKDQVLLEIENIIKNNEHAIFINTWKTQRSEL